GRFLRMVQRGKWEYVTRSNARGVVSVVAMHDDGRVVLVEQYRPPVDAQVIELPAGLAGDEDKDESLLDAAKRELEEETGYVAAHWTKLITGLSSGGMTDETTTFFRATDLTRAHEGGGVDSESIIVHEVHVDELFDFLARHQARGKKVEMKLLAGIYAAVSSRFQ
ncbi:MAG: NUDIX hydrolase, partial [Rhodospirillales bacterium]|nr:NUDIX hydrolase [Rhodospirillales bacterium]